MKPKTDAETHKTVTKKAEGVSYHVLPGGSGHAQCRWMGGWTAQQQKIKHATAQVCVLVKVAAGYLDFELQQEIQKAAGLPRSVSSTTDYGFQNSIVRSCEAGYGYDTENVARSKEPRQTAARL